MRISRTRFKLAFWFAGTFFVSLTLLDVAFYFVLVRDARAGFTDALLQEAADLQAAVYADLADDEDEEEAPLAVTTSELLDEWPSSPTRFVVYGRGDHLLGTRGPPAETAELQRVKKPANDGSVWMTVLNDSEHFMLTETSDTGELGLRVVAARSTASLKQYRAVLIQWIVISVPVVTLLAVLSGYLLAKRSLRPVVHMSRTIADMSPNALETRLTVRDPPDELDQLAAQFNALMGRLVAAREQNRRFVAQAAHQIRTPLTLVRGESELSLEGPHEASHYVAALRRIRAAAEQMAHRVNELFMLAHAEAGELPQLKDEVELDGLVLECTDLMRGRANAAHRTLELSRVHPGTARGNEVLLREAVMELIENALRHGSAEGSIRVSAYVEHGMASLTVTNHGGSVSLPDQDASPGQAESSNLGLSIVRWIAEVHGGELRYARTNGENQFAVRWPAEGTDAQ